MCGIQLLGDRDLVAVILLHPIRWVDNIELYQLYVDSVSVNRISAIRSTSFVANAQIPRQIFLWQIDAKLQLRARWQPRVACVKKQGKEGPELVLEVARQHMNDAFLHGVAERLG